MEKFEGEKEALKRYKIHMKLREEFKKLTSGSSWRTLMESTLAQENLKVHWGTPIYIAKQLVY